MRFHTVISLLSLLWALLLLPACGSSYIGTIPRGTPDLGDGTLAVIPAITPDPQLVFTAPPTAVGATYAYVRKNQLWTARNAATPVQATHFDYVGTSNVFWHQPLWSPGDRFIAFIMNARPAGLGGGGCPAPDFSANGALYIMDFTTDQLTKITVPADSGDAVVSSPYNGYWQYIFWEDSTHLLAWYNGVTGTSSNSAGLYRYDLNSKTLALVIPLRSLGVATLFHVQAGLPLLLSMRYSSEQLFYQIIVHPFERLSQFVIYRRSIIHPEMPGSKVLETGSEPWCTPQQNGPFVKPGWDVAPDGEQLAAQMIVVNDAGQGSATISALNLNDHSMTDLFAQASTQMLGQDLTLTWGPDSQTIVATTYHAPAQNGPYSATLANPAATEQYTPDLAGQVTWRTDSSAFALQNVDTVSTSTSSDVYMFITGDSQGQLLLTDARDFMWG